MCIVLVCDDRDAFPQMQVQKTHETRSVTRARRLSEEKVGGEKKEIVSPIVIIRLIYTTLSLHQPTVSDGMRRVPIRAMGASDNSLEDEIVMQHLTRAVPLGQRVTGFTCLEGTPNSLSLSRIVHVDASSCYVQRGLWHRRVATIRVRVKDRRSTLSEFCSNRERVIQRMSSHSHRRLPTLQSS